jgi:hypothetical protein
MPVPRGQVLSAINALVSAAWRATYFGEARCTSSCPLVITRHHHHHHHHHQPRVLPPPLATHRHLGRSLCTGDGAPPRPHRGASDVNNARTPAQARKTSDAARGGRHRGDVAGASRAATAPAPADREVQRNGAVPSSSSPSSSSSWVATSPAPAHTARQLNTRIVQCNEVGELRDLIATVGAPALTIVNLATAVTRLAKLCRARGGDWRAVDADGAASNILERTAPAAAEVANRMAPQVSGACLVG